MLAASQRLLAPWRGSQKTETGETETWWQAGLRMDAPGFSLFQAVLVRGTRGSCCSSSGPAGGGVSPALGLPPARVSPAPPPADGLIMTPAPPRPGPRPARLGDAANVEPGSQVLLRTAGSLATESIIPSRWCSHGVMDITHDSLRQSRNSLVTRGPLYTK